MNLVQLTTIDDKDSVAVETTSNFVAATVPVEDYVLNPALTLDSRYEDTLGVNDDWNATASEKRSSHELETRELSAHYSSQSGTDWWGAHSGTGFERSEASLGQYRRKAKAMPSKTVTTVLDSVDADEVRVAAKLHKAESWNDRPKVQGMYRDFISAAILTTEGDETLWGPNGYSWDLLDEVKSNEAYRAAKQHDFVSGEAAVRRI